MSTLVITNDIWRKLRDHLLANHEESAAFLLTKPAGQRLLVRDVVLIPGRDIERRPDSLSVGLPALVDVMNRAARENAILVEAHSHPLSQGRVGFSAIDDLGQAEMVAYLSDVMPGRPYGAIVIGHGAVQGRVWRNGEATPLDHVLVAGEPLDSWPGDGSPPATCVESTGQQPGRYDRQIRAFGRAGQERIAGSHVTIVGLGGIGSIVAMELAHLGVREITLIDDDRVEEPNLNRLAGATSGDVGRLKVEVATDQFLRTNPDSRPVSIPAEIREMAALEAVASADVLIGCVDTDSGRLILNEIALSHLIPYIDCAAGIFAPNGSMEAAGGQVTVWLPGRPCLVCCGEIDRTVAAQELESPEQREFRRREGYVAGADVPEPAVMSLNGTISSIAVTEFLALVTGFRPANHYTYYDMLEQRVGQRQVKRDPRCFTCSIEGTGDDAGLGRYSKRALPRDVPHLE